MTYSSYTTKKEIANRVKNAFTVIRDEQFKVHKLGKDDDSTVIFQVCFINKLVTLNDLLTLGLAQYNASILANENQTLITWSVNA